MSDYVGFHPSFDPLLRLLIPLVESYADINHVYGEPCPWIFSKTVKRRPVILSIVAEKGDGNLGFFERCRKIIVQSDFQSVQEADAELKVYLNFIIT